MELDEFIPLVFALRAVTLNLADEDAELRSAFDKYDINHSGKLDHKELRGALTEVKLQMDSEKAKALRKEKATKPPARSSSSTPMLAAKLSEEEVGAKPASAPPKKPTDDDDQYEYYDSGDEKTPKPDLAKKDVKPADDDEYEYYDGDGEEDAPKK